MMCVCVRQMKREKKGADQFTKQATHTNCNANILQGNGIHLVYSRKLHQYTLLNPDPRKHGAHIWLWRKDEIRQNETLFSQWLRQA